MSSAPRTDGISNKFIKHFWHLFQKTLLEYSNHCFETRKLTDSFRGAKIRLIPLVRDPDLAQLWEDRTQPTNIMEKGRLVLGIIPAELQQRKRAQRVSMQVVKLQTRQIGWRVRTASAGQPVMHSS